MSEVCQEFNIKLLVFGVLLGKHLTTWSQMKYKRYIDATGGWEQFPKTFK